MKITTSLKTMAVLAAVALPFATLSAHEGEDHNHGPTPGMQTGSATEAWANAQTSLKAIQAAAAAKEQAPIHTEQEKLAAALKQIQEKSSGTENARLEGAIKNAIAASEKVHVAADANDFAKVDASLKTLEATMAMVEKQMPQK